MCFGYEFQFLFILPLKTFLQYTSKSQLCVSDVTIKKPKLLLEMTNYNAINQGIVSTKVFLKSPATG